MNEQLRKAIEEATRVVDIFELYDKAQMDASQAKLLRVIELLVQQRDEALADNALPVHMTLKSISKYDADLIAALEVAP